MVAPGNKESSTAGKSVGQIGSGQLNPAGVCGTSVPTSPKAVAQVLGEVSGEGLQGSPACSLPGLSRLQRPPPLPQGAVTAPLGSGVPSMPAPLQPHGTCSPRPPPPTPPTNTQPKQSGIAHVPTTLPYGFQGAGPPRPPSKPGDGEGVAGSLFHGTTGKNRGAPPGPLAATPKGWGQGQDAERAAAMGKGTGPRTSDEVERSASGGVTQQIELKKSESPLGAEVWNRDALPERWQQQASTANDIQAKASTRENRPWDSWISTAETSSSSSAPWQVQKPDMSSAGLEPWKIGQAAAPQEEMPLSTTGSVPKGGKFRGMVSGTEAGKLSLNGGESWKASSLGSQTLPARTAPESNGSARRSSVEEEQKVLTSELLWGREEGDHWGSRSQADAWPTPSSGSSSLPRRRAEDGGSSACGSYAVDGPKPKSTPSAGNDSIADTWGASFGTASSSNAMPGGAPGDVGRPKGWLPRKGGKRKGDDDEDGTPSKALRGEGAFDSQESKLNWLVPSKGKQSAAIPPPGSKATAVGPKEGAWPKTAARLPPALPKLPQPPAPPGATSQEWWPTDSSSELLPPPDDSANFSDLPDAGARQPRQLPRPPARDLPKKRGRTPVPLRGLTPKPTRGKTPVSRRSVKRGKTPVPLRGRTPVPLRSRTPTVLRMASAKTRALPRPKVAPLPTPADPGTGGDTSEMFGGANFDSSFGGENPLSPRGAESAGQFSHTWGLTQKSETDGQAEYDPFALPTVDTGHLGAAGSARAGSPEAGQDDASGSISVFDLPESWTDAELLNEFSRFGTVASCHVPVSREGKPKGFGFVEFESARSAREAITALDGKCPAGASYPLKVRARRKASNS